MSKPKHRSGGAWLRELIVIVVVAVGLAFLIQAFLVKPFRIPSVSMLPTLKVGERVLANRIGLRFSDPKRFNIVVFHPPAGEATESCGVRHPVQSPCPLPTKEKSKVNFIKRVVGLPGDRLSIKGGNVYINGKKQDQKGIITCNEPEPKCDMPKPIKIPPDHYFMMGDNRPGSADSRFWGPVPKDWMIGKAFFSYWPPNTVGPL